MLQASFNSLPAQNPDKFLVWGLGAWIRRNAD